MDILIYQFHEVNSIFLDEILVFRTAKIIIIKYKK